MDREDWLAKRRCGITGTDIGILMGVNPWKKEKDLILDKLGLSIPFLGNAATKTGVLLESHVASQWSKEYQKILTPGEFTTHPEIPFAIGTPDFLFPGGGLEIKTGGESTWKKGLPRYYDYQCQWYSFITGRPDWHLSALMVPKDRSECPDGRSSHQTITEWCAERPRRDFEITIDPDLQQRMVIRADEFLQRLELMKASRRF